jgi:hypothetical protein
VDEIDPCTERCGDVNGFVHLLGVGPGFQALRRIGLDAVGALLGVRHGEPDESLLPFAERPVRAGRGVVIIEELRHRRRRESADFTEAREVAAIVIASVTRAAGWRLDGITSMCAARGNLRSRGVRWIDGPEIASHFGAIDLEGSKSKLHRTSPCGVGGRRIDPVFLGHLDVTAIDGLTLSTLGDMTPTEGCGAAGHLVEAGARLGGLFSDVDAVVVDERSRPLRRVVEEVVLRDVDGREDHVDSPEKGVLYVAVLLVLRHASGCANAIVGEGGDVVDVDVNVDGLGLLERRGIRELRAEDREDLLNIAPVMSFISENRLRVSANFLGSSCMGVLLVGVFGAAS